VTRLADVTQPVGQAFFAPIIRSRVVQRIEIAAAGRIILIVAPAGYGKSLALSHWLAQQSRPYLRFDVQAEHNTLLGFARGVAEAFSPTFPALPKTVSTASQNSALAATPGNEMARWMAAHLETFEGIIVIDDFHRASDDVDISRFVASLIARTKARIQWVLATRSTLDLPVASWLAYGDAHFVIGDRDLTFREDEMRELSEHSEGPLAEPVLRGIMDATSGWPVALSLALRNSAVIQGSNLTSSTREMLFQYLAEQVYEGLSTGEREVLHLASYLPSVDVRVIEAAGYRDCAHILETVRRRATFLSLEAPGSYKCHDLFRDFLSRQLEISDPVRARALQAKAAAALEDVGNIVAALRLYSRLQANAQVLRILHRHGFDLMDHSHGDVIEKALRVLPQDARTSDAVILGLRAQREADAGHFDTAEALFRRAMDLESGPNVRLKLAIALAILLRNQGRPIADLLIPLSNISGAIELHGELEALLAVDSALSKDSEHSVIRIQNGEQICLIIESDEVRAKILLRLGIARMSIGLSSDEVIRNLSDAACLAERIGMLGLAAKAYNALGMAQLFYLNDSKRTLESAHRASEAAAKSGDRFAVHSALAYEITAEINLGNLIALESLLSRIHEAATSDIRRNQSIQLYTRATILAWKGRLEESLELMCQLATTGYGYYDFDQIFNMATHALYAAATGQSVLSKRLVAQVILGFKTCSEPHSYGATKRSVALLLCVIAETFDRRYARAKRVLGMLPGNIQKPAQALRDAVTVIVDARGDWATECFFRLQSLEESGYAGLARTVKSCARRWLSENRDVRSKDARLTQAEREMLLALDAGYSPKEIAARTRRSVHTVRTLIQRAVQRLECNGRQEALAEARRLGFLSEIVKR
jgi:ATP/maltotriose-dependent transcriptional regulator MalT